MLTLSVFAFATLYIKGFEMAHLIGKASAIAFFLIGSIAQLYSSVSKALYP